MKQSARGPIALSPFRRTMQCHCNVTDAGASEQIRTGDITIESAWFYPLSHNTRLLLYLSSLAERPNSKQKKKIYLDITANASFPH